MVYIDFLNVRREYTMPYKNNINDASDLVTSKEETRAGFISFALEKNRRSTPYIIQARALHDAALKAKIPTDLLKMPEVRLPLITASGLSDKSLAHLTDEDIELAIAQLVKNFLEPAGSGFVDELVYRFLLIKGDSLGGSMRNIVGAIAQQKLIRALLANMSNQGIEYHWIDGKNVKKWIKMKDDDLDIELNLKAISWKSKKGSRILSFNLNIPLVKNNIDICLFNAEMSEYKAGAIVKTPEKSIMLGELKGGIDPAGADEHWKTANTALDRIRKAYSGAGYKISTSFIGAAIENKMAGEIFDQLQNGILTNAINLTKQIQLNDYCSWLLDL